MQGRATNAKQNVAMTEQQLKKACQDLEKSIAETEKETEATGLRIQKLEQHRTDVAERMGSAGEFLYRVSLCRDPACTLAGSLGQERAMCTLV